MSHVSYHHGHTHTPSSAVFALPDPHNHHHHSRSPAVKVPYHHTPERVHTNTIVANSLLMYRKNPSHLPLEFDVSLPPSQITISRSSSHFSSLTSRHLTQPATNPPLQFLRLESHLLPWPIDVYPSTHSGSGIVTVGDVLQTIYHSLRHHVRGSDWHSLSAGEQEDVRSAWDWRCKRQRTHDDRMYEESQGLRRVDWLVRNTVFEGLSPANSRHPSGWTIHLKERPKTVKFTVDS